MREIKFRAWDVFHEKGMSKPFGIGARYAEFDDGSKDIVDFVKQDFMQYTGLKDKNGKEIYEGDVIRYENFEEFPKSMVVEWCDKTAGFVRGNYSIGINPNKHEIIGNIHQNPELLEISHD